jgi:hypothetical protein
MASGAERPRTEVRTLPAVIRSEQVEFALESLPREVRENVEQRLAYLEQMPRMYAMTDDGRYPGCRSFWVDPCYRVFYMVAASADDVYVAALTAEEVDGPTDAVDL